MEGIEQKAIELIEKFEALAVDIAPQAIELGLMAARVAAGQDVFQVVLHTCIVVALAVVGTKFVRRGFAVADKEDKKHEEEVPYFVVSGLASILGAVSLVTLFVRASIWPFVGIFYPELWIAKQVLGW